MDALMVALLAWCGAAGAWLWRGAVLEHDRVAGASEPWQQVRSRYPMPEEFHLEPDSSETLSQDNSRICLKTIPRSDSRQIARYTERKEAKSPCA